MQQLGASGNFLWFTTLGLTCSNMWRTRVIGILSPLITAWLGHALLWGDWWIREIYVWGKIQQGEECCVNVPKCSPRGTRFSLSPSPACCSCPDQFKRWEEDGLAVLFGEGREGRALGIVWLDCVGGKRLFLQTDWGRNKHFISCVLKKLRAGCSWSFQGGSQQVWRE